MLWHEVCADGGGGGGMWLCVGEWPCCGGGGGGGEWLCGMWLCGMWLCVDGGGDGGGGGGGGGCGQSEEVRQNLYPPDAPQQ